MNYLRKTRIHYRLFPMLVCSLRPLILFLTLTCCLIPFALAASQTGDIPSQTVDEVELNLGKSAVCELVKNGIPYNTAIAFSISLGRIYCFTDFIEVGAKTVIFHNWYHRSRKRASVKLALRPPRWATFSSVELRDDDKGPWQVEVTTEKGEVLQILRFSVID